MHALLSCYFLNCLPTFTIVEQTIRPTVSHLNRRFLKLLADFHNGGQKELKFQTALPYKSGLFPRSVAMYI